MRFITGSQVFSGKEFLKDNTVLVVKQDGTIEDVISPESIDNTKIEHFDGILTPGFINTHCHLELSHLKDTINRHTGIVDFGLGIMKHRNTAPVEVQLECMQQADKLMQEQGIVAVGDISNIPLSVEVKKHSALYYHTFVELIGLNPERADLIFDTGKATLLEFEKNKLSASLAPHAPYSSSPELIRKITDNCYAQEKPTSMHNQESKAENLFFEQKTGDYIRLYDTIGIPISYFEATGKSSLQTVIPAFNTGVQTLLVHNTFTGKEDITAAQSTHNRLYWCLCPHANLYIENTLPDVELLRSRHCTLTLGTDSLASNSGLSVMDEINCLIVHQPELPLQLLLQAATFNGAEFLGIEHNMGLLGKHKKPGINVIENKTGAFSVKKLA